MNQTLVEVYTLHLQLLCIEGRTLGDLTSLFGVQWDPIHPRYPVQEFRSIIAQDGKIVHAGDFVKLSLPFHDVRFICLFIDL